MPLLIPLNSTVFVRQCAQRFDRVTPGWPDALRFKALAAMLGYASWEALVRATSAATPMFEYDQDLEQGERETRWLGMAQRVARATGLELPLALMVVHRILPTSDQSRPAPLWYEPNAIFDAAQSKDDSLWWCNFTEHGHPLVPPGFGISRARNYGHLCRSRRSQAWGADVADGAIEQLWVLLPDNHTEKRGVRGAHQYFRRGDLVEVDPLPFGDWLRAPAANAHLLDEFFKDYYPQLDGAGQKRQIRAWRDAMRDMNTASGQPAQSRRRWMQFTISMRAALSKDWMWPLTTQSSAETIESALLHAQEVDSVIKKHFQRDPGCVRMV